MISYIIRTEEDRYFIKNTSETVALSVDLSKEVCASQEWDSIGDYNLASNEEMELTLLKEGHFRLILNDGAETATRYVKAYFTSIKNLIEDLDRIFCGFNKNCNNCNEETDINKMLLTGVSQLEVIKRLLNPEINAVMQEIYTFTICYYQDLLNCQADSNFINGKYSSPEKLIKKLLALDYIGLYLYYKINQGNPVFPELSYIDSLFNSKDLICCIEKNLNINFTEIQDKIDSANIISTPQ